MRKILLWLMETRFWSWILLSFLPYLRFSMYYTRFEGEKFVEGYSILRQGQFLLCLDEKKATTFLVPGFMTHACYVVNSCWYLGNREYEIGEMIREGYAKSYFFTAAKESSRILICECVDWDPMHRARMIAATVRFYKSKYGVNFSLGVSALYCSELVFQLDRIAANPAMTDAQLCGSEIKGKMKVDLCDLAGLGRPYISPDGLLFAKNTRVVWDSDGKMTGMMGADAEVYCRSQGYIK